MASRSINLITYVSSSFKYFVKHDGKTIETTVTNKVAIAEGWVSEILLIHSDNKNPVVGLDVKWEDSSDELVSNKCSILQLCMDTKCLILQLLYMDIIPLSLKSFLMNSKFTFVGVDVDMIKLAYEYGLWCARAQDIRTSVIDKWLDSYNRHDLEYLAKEIFKLEMKQPDHEHFIKWAARVLNEKQVLYACNLAHFSYKIVHTLFVGKRKLHDLSLWSI